MALPDPDVGLRQAARGAQQQRHGMVGHRHRIRAGTIRDHDAARLRGGQIDVLVPHAQRAHDTQLWQRGHFIGVKARRAARQHGAYLVAVLLDRQGARLRRGRIEGTETTGFDSGQIVLDAVDQNQ
ncbi:hypothetical protein D3C72_2039220 [compost metagenome]